jgi:hypothetical protein
MDDSLSENDDQADQLSGGVGDWIVESAFKAIERVKW